MRTALSTRPALWAALAAFAVVSAGAVARVPPTLKGEWDTASVFLVTNSVYRKVTVGWGAPMGYPHPEPGAHADWYSDDPTSVYRRQFGLPVYALAAAAPADRDGLERALAACRYVVALGAAAAFAVVVGLLVGRAGVPPSAGVLGAVVVAADPWQSSLLSNLYWLPILTLLPVAVVLALYRPGRRVRPVGACFAAALFVKALGGYEYVSVPLLTGPAAVVLLGWAAGRRAVARDSLKLICWGAAGVAAALAVHSATLYIQTGSVDEVVANTVANAAKRSQAADSFGTLSGWARSLYSTLAHNKGVAALLGAWGLASAAWVAGRPWRRADDLNRLAVASWVAFAAVLSWAVLMKNHTAIHPQYNGMLFLAGFVPLAAAFVAGFARRLFFGIPPVPVAGGT